MVPARFLAGEKLMKASSAILLFIGALVFTGCTSLFTDPLKVAYEAGEISREEYELGCVERDEALARDSSAHWELQQIISQNRANLPRE